MKTKNYIQLSSLVAVISALSSTSANAQTSIYANNASALNINMLTDTFVSYTHNGENLSDLFDNQMLYGTMTRLDEYGDDGTTIPGDYISDKKSDYLIKGIWMDVNHINGHAHYNNNSSKLGRFNLVALGATSKSIKLPYGDISFGGFAGYINSDMAQTNTYGDVGGIFARYNFNKFKTMVLANIGSMNNNSGYIDFNNSWVNIATEAIAELNIDKTFMIRPGLSLSYTFVSSDDLYVNNDIVWSKDFNFLNIAPSVQFVKQISQNWFGAFSAKYIAHFDSDNDITVAGIHQDGINMDNHFDLGLDIEHDFKHLTFGGKIHKQIGGIDGWSGNLVVKYMF